MSANCPVSAVQAGGVDKAVNSLALKAFDSTDSGSSIPCRPSRGWQRLSCQTPLAPCSPWAPSCPVPRRAAPACAGAGGETGGCSCHGGRQLPWPGLGCRQRCRQPCRQQRTPVCLYGYGGDRETVPPRLLFPADEVTGLRRLSSVEGESVPPWPRHRAQPPRRSSLPSPALAVPAALAPLQGTGAELSGVWALQQSSARAPGTTVALQGGPRAQVSPRVPPPAPGSTEETLFRATLAFVPNCCMALLWERPSQGHGMPQPLITNI